jgi:hypothetical protein
MNIPKEKPFRQLDKQLVLCLQCTIVIHIEYNCVLYMILILPRHCLIYDPDSSLSLSYRWSTIPLTSKTSNDLSPQIFKQKKPGQWHGKSRSWLGTGTKISMF